MYVPNDYTQNYPFCRLQLVVEAIGHSTLCTNQSKLNESSKAVMRIRSRCHKTLGANVPSLPSLEKTRN